MVFRSIIGALVETTATVTIIAIVVTTYTWTRTTLAKVTKFAGGLSSQTNAAEIYVPPKTARTSNPTAVSWNSKELAKDFPAEGSTRNLGNRATNAIIEDTTLAYTSDTLSFPPWKCNREILVWSRCDE